MLRDHALPEVDTFSWTADHRAWTLNSWGFDVLAALVYRGGGLPAVALLGAALVMVIGGLYLWQCRALHAVPAVSVTVFLLAAPFLMKWLAVRPQLVDFIALPLLMIVLQRILVGHHRPQNIVATGLLAIAWTNLHASALLGLAVIGATLSVATLIRRQTRTLAALLVAAAVYAAGCLLNPYGLGLVEQAFSVRDASTGVVLEWQHLDPTSPGQLLMAAAGLLALFLSVRRRDVVLVGTLGVLLLAAVSAIRFLPMVVLIGLPILAASASAPPVLRYLRSRRLVMLPGAGIAMLTLIVLAVPSLAHVGRVDPEAFPRNLVNQIPRNCLLFNSYSFGGYVILERPDVRVSMDSRNDLYGAGEVLAQGRVIDGKGDLTRGLRGAGCVLVPPQSGLARRLERDPEWLTKGREPTAALFVRRPRG